MTAETPKHVVFDIGRVLIHYDPHLGLEEVIPDEAERRFFLAEVCTHEWNLEQDRGRPWAEAEAEAIARHPDRADQIRSFRRNWSKMVPHAYDDSVGLMLGLIEAGVDVTMLTNFAPDTFVEARAKFPFLDRPRGVTVSGEVREIKPDRAIYDLHVERFGLDPSASLFIDDSQKNVDGARAAGWQAVLFVSPGQLARDLSERGLPVAAG
ncbi:HAD family hydrolase [Jiella sonneratiae]|uniref:HAD family phosphatase n=1 Tax=Jiella sonneratiae TaxID=2816856 RepID=A0ABS3IZE9_9HYPH|nr:HAD family phosphatase [Jiella sonneratiae]MBO0902792.1 HAD family phosphatase [Jiella sonneratiae]